METAALQKKKGNVFIKDNTFWTQPSSEQLKPYSSPIIVSKHHQSQNTELIFYSLSACVPLLPHCRPTQKSW